MRVFEEQWEKIIACFHEKRGKGLIRSSRCCE